MIKLIKSSSCLIILLLLLLFEKTLIILLTKSLINNNFIILIIKIYLAYTYLLNLNSIYSILNSRTNIVSVSWLILWISLIYINFKEYKFHKIDFIYFLIGVYLADLSSGLVHIYLDNSKQLGDKTLIDGLRAGFQVHHSNCISHFENPKYRAYHEMNMVYPYTVLVLFFLQYFPNKLKIILITFASGSVLQQTTHYWCHARTNNLPMLSIGKILQGISVEQEKIINKNNNKVFNKIISLWKLNIVLSPIAHRKHHTHITYNTNFCILTGWANPLLNYLNDRFYLTKSDSLYIQKFDKLLN